MAGSERLISHPNCLEKGTESRREQRDHNESYMHGLQLGFLLNPQEHFPSRMILTMYNERIHREV